MNYLATASVLNVILMRKHEAAQGIDVLDKSGKIVGTSRKAAKKVRLLQWPADQAHLWGSIQQLCYNYFDYRH